MKWKYEKGEGRHKHEWNKDEAGFVCGDKSDVVGKCPNNITHVMAEELLNKGIPYINPRKKPLYCSIEKDGVVQSIAFPHAIYNVYQGIPYHAAPTRGCCSFHAYPELESKLPPEIKAQLLERAKQQGHKKEFNKWCDYSKKELKKCHK